MRRFLLALAFVQIAYSQGPPANPDQLRFIEVVGCLSQTGANWMLTSASDPAASPSSFTTPEAVKAAAAKSLGTQQYRLLGIRSFSPEGHKGHKMVAKGLLVKSGSENRINLTSFQMLAETCAK